MNRTARIFGTCACALSVAAAAAIASSDKRAAHPFLFTTQAQAERARKAVRQHPEFARLAKLLVERARSGRVEALPALERAWWEAARQKPWAEIYPEIFHHTWIVPLKWAELARTCARATLLAPAPELAAKAKGILLTLADYTFEFEHFDVGMNYTIWVVQALDAYDILHGQFSAAERARMDAFFARFLAAVEKNDDYWVAHEPGGKLNNHYAWHKLAFAMIGLFYDRPELVEKALHGPKGVVFMLAHGFKDDGLWLEGSIPYQFAETSALLLLAQILEHAGHPTSLFGFSTADGLSLKQSYDALIPLLLPDRTLPTIGDCYARRLHLAEYPDWETLHDRFGDATYAWLLADRTNRVAQALFAGVPRLPRTAPPPQRSRLWPEMGYLALRSVEGADYWSGRGWTVFASYAGQPVHEHADKLSIILFADGHLWLPDLEAKTSAEHAFSSPVQARLNRQTLCHNTLLVDGQSQRFPGQRLDLLEFKNLPGVKRATIGDLAGRLYPGVRQLRTLIVRDEYVLDFFQAGSGAQHEFAWLSHVNGRSVGGSLGELESFTLPAKPPWSYLQDPRRGKASERVWEDFTQGEKRLRLDVLADGPLEVVHCGFPLDDSAGSATIPMRMLRRSGSSAWFLAVYRTSRTDVPLDLKVTRGELDSLAISIGLAGKTRQHVVPALKPF